MFLRSGVSCQLGINRLGVVLPPPLVLASRSSAPGICHRDLPTSLNGARLAARPTLLGSASVVTKPPGPGLSTWCPSAAARACALGPTNPPRIIRAAEPSGLRWRGFAPLLVVTHPDIRTRPASTEASAPASTAERRSPTTRSHEASVSAASAVCLSPVESSAHGYSTSLPGSVCGTGRRLSA